MEKSRGKGKKRITEIGDFWKIYHSINPKLFNLIQTNGHRKPKTLIRLEPLIRLKPLVSLLIRNLY